MQVINDISWENTKNTAVALGYFDGLHIGHQHLINRMIGYSVQHELDSAIFTFIKHSNINHKGADIYTQADKINILTDMGLDLMYSPNFEQFSDLTPEEFVKNILIKSMGAKAVFCGKNFFFGKDRQGDVPLLKKLCENYNIDFHISDTILCDGEYVSSTAIRNYLIDGKIEKVNKFLGRPYSVTLPVNHGEGNGKFMGTPTINQIFPKNMCTPREGVYITRTNVSGRIYPSATGFGKRPTVNGNTTTCETYILGFNGNLYGQKIKVEFYKYIMPIKKYDSLSDLSNMIKEVANESKKYLTDIKKI
jgi:riboflavin kinase/FMN adenylyltransferase